MRFWSHDRHGFPLPQGHRFPLPKYRLLREAVESDGFAVHEALPVAWADLNRAHDPTWLGRVRRGELTDREQRALGLPWSPELVERSRRAVQGTIEAMRDALAHGIGMNLGGGTHHAGRAAGRGFCLLNDVAVAIRVHRPDRVLVVDCDVHQGDGTAELFADDASVFTLSLHGGANYPFRRARSDLDVDLADGTGDDAYLEALADALAQTPDADLVVYLAGADPWHGDRLGRLALTKEALAKRDEMVLDLGPPTCVVLAGGYAPDVRDTVDINLATVRAVATLRAAGP
jgi:acetoin utilization deacetylase AcuC-like enzyme